MGQLHVACADSQEAAREEAGELLVLQLVTTSPQHLASTEQACWRGGWPVSSLVQLPPEGSGSRHAYCLPPALLLALHVGNMLVGGRIAAMPRLVLVSCEPSIIPRRGKALNASHVAALQLSVEPCLSLSLSFLASLSMRPCALSWPSQVAQSTSCMQGAVRWTDSSLEMPRN